MWERGRSPRAGENEAALPDIEGDGVCDDDVARKGDDMAREGDVGTRK